MQDRTDGKESEIPKESLAERAEREFAVTEAEKRSYKAGYYFAYQTSIAPGEHRCDCWTCKTIFREEQEKALQSYCKSQPFLRLQEAEKREREIARNKDQARNNSLSEFKGNEPDIPQIHSPDNHG
jgi:hypothetical protein